MLFFSETLATLTSLGLILALNHFKLSLEFTAIKLVSPCVCTLATLGIGLHANMQIFCRCNVTHAKVNVSQVAMPLVLRNSKFKILGRLRFLTC